MLTWLLADSAQLRERGRSRLHILNRPTTMILRDPVHGLIAFESPEDSVVEPLLATGQVQRLRRIRQLGFTSLAYPGAEHSRFAHAVGTAHVMCRLLRRLRGVDHALPSDQRVDPFLARDAIAAALLHDIGHGPLSHMFESALPHADPHEVWTSRMILDPESDVHRVLGGFDPDMPRRVARLVEGQHDLTYLAKAVSGTFDVDRCDYLLRDAHATGVRYGHFDLDWLHRSLRFAPNDAINRAPPLAIDGPKGLAAIESFVLARLFMFQQVYFHKATRAAEWMVRTALARAVGLLQAGVTLSSVPSAVRAAAQGHKPSLAEYLELDDTVLATTLRAWEDARDPVLADMCRRLRARDLMKTIDLTGELQDDPVRQSEAAAIAQEITARAGLDPDGYVGLDRARDIPFDDTRDPLVVVYPRGTPKRPAEVSFLLGRLNGQALTRVRLVVAPQVRNRIEQALPS